MNERLEEMTGVEGSGWVLEEILGVDLQVAAYDGIGGSSYIPTPLRIVGKRAIVNVQNKDDRCFEWTILAHIYPAKKHTERTFKYEKYLG